MSTRYHIGAIMAARILDSGAGDKAFAALALRNKRCGFDRPVTPSSLAQHLAETHKWLEAEVEAGRDPTVEELQDAGSSFGRTITLADVPQSPSQG